MLALSNGAMILTLATDEVFPKSWEHLAKLSGTFGNDCCSRRTSG
jgi:hypothetical protein